MRKTFVIDAEIPDLDVEVEVNGEECTVIRVEILGTDITSALKVKTLRDIEAKIEDEHLRCEHEYDSSEGNTCLNCGKDGTEDLAAAAEAASEGER